jgi:hypothetical protein
MLGRPLGQIVNSTINRQSPIANPIANRDSPNRQCPDAANRQSNGAIPQSPIVNKSSIVSRQSPMDAAAAA